MSQGTPLAEQTRTRAGLLTAWPRQETRTIAERLTVPLIAFTVWAYLPAPAVHHLPFAVFTAAMGQCLLFTRTAYDRIGGHAAVREPERRDEAFAVGEEVLRATRVRQLERDRPRRRAGVTRDHAEHRRGRQHARAGGRSRREGGPGRAGRR